MTPLQMVRQFHEAFGVPAYSPKWFRVPSKDRQRLRRRLIREEYRETMRALRKGNKPVIGDIKARHVEIADGLADLVVVIYGTALEYGIDLDAVLAEVHRSNMSKLGAEGKPILREDGKVLKGPNYSPPNLKPLLGMGE